MTSISASAPAKVILTGEHAVVYNEPSLVMAINKRARVTVSTSRRDGVKIYSKNIGETASFSLDGTEHSQSIAKQGVHLNPYPGIVRHLARRAQYSGGLRISIESEIPRAAGLGSSAAVAVAMVAALGKCFDLNLAREEVSKSAYQAEKIVHGRPSGIDNLISTYGGLIVFRRNEGFLRVESHPKLEIIIGMTDIERSTGEQIARVAETIQEHGEVGQLLLHCIGHLTVQTVQALRAGKIRTVGRLLSLNHWLVNALGVSHPVLDRLVYASLGAGALGAKLTGAGGGGCMIALVTKRTRSAVERAIEGEGFTTIPARLSRAGVRIEA